MQLRGASRSIPLCALGHESNPAHFILCSSCSRNNVLGLITDGNNLNYQKRYCNSSNELCIFFVMLRSGARPCRNSAVGVLKGVLIIILQRKFAMMGESEPIVINSSGVCGSTPLRQYCTLYRGKAPTRCFGIGSVGRKKLPSCSQVK
jgi:hypothetical protein